MQSQWIHPALVVKNTPGKGKGVFTTQALKKNERLAVFGGDILLIDEISLLPDHMQDYPLQIEERFAIAPKAALQPEPADFFNHSCTPNAGIKGQIFLVAMRDIEALEEITFDYAMVLSKPVGSDLVFNMACVCGTPNCRKLITQNDWQLKELQMRYAGFFSTYLQELIDKNQNQSKA